MEVLASRMNCACMLLFMLTTASAASFRSVSPPPPSTCHRRQFKSLLHDLNSQCPFVTLPSVSPIQVDGESFEGAVSSIQKNEYIAVLFHASWCPFSEVFLSKFSTLSAMYPQIKHLTVDQSSAMPSVFSRYGIHSLPSLLIVNQKAVTSYYGKKDLQSLVNFYRRTTGLDPVVDIADDTSSNLGKGQNVASLKETFSRDPYLFLSVIFVLSRACLYFFPGIASNLMAMWITYIAHLNLGIFAGSRQLTERVAHLLDVKRIWSKLKVCKTRNFHQGARNARVWASSLASVSLGETSSSSRISSSS